MPHPQISFTERLQRSIISKQTPLIVGLDPRVSQLPNTLKPATHSLSLIAQAYETFCRQVIEIVAPLVPAVKIQAAFFEELGVDGVVAMGHVIDSAKRAGLLVIMDAKRGDIGSTAIAYAKAYLGEKPLSPWGCDALTVNPYLGSDTLKPFVDTAEENAAGLFILVKTSNPGSSTLQDQIVDGHPLYRIVAQQVQDLAIQSSTPQGYGLAGAVVGATYPHQLTELRSLMPNSYLLIPGYGAQGGTAADIAAGFDDQGLGAVVNSSRGIIFAYETPRYQAASNWMAAVELATQDAIAEIAADTSAGRLRVS